MAERRMFAKTIVLSDAFLDLPMSARCLYFTLGMLADDDGFINSPKAIMRQCGASEDDLNVLLLKRFVLAFDSGIIVIKHWRINNYLRNDRYTETKYLEEKSLLELDENSGYKYTNIDAGIPVGIPNTVSTGKDSIGKDSIGKDIDRGTKRFTPPTIEEVQAYINEKNYIVDAERFINFYDANGWMIGKNKMKKWTSTLANWNKTELERREKERKANEDPFERIFREVEGDDYRRI